jgi:hypothetical protein
VARRVFKYQFDVDDDIVIEMPAGAQVLKADAQDGIPTLWALVDDTAPGHQYHFTMRGTGHPIPDDIGPHVGSFFHGPFVWHLFWAGVPGA